MICTWTTYFRAISTRRIYKDKLTSVQYDGDLKMLHYRHDLLTDPEEMAAFKEKYGYDLSTPKTWQQYLDIARFFTRPEQNLYGSGEIAGFFSYFTWEDHFSRYGRALI